MKLHLLKSCGLSRLLSFGLIAISISTIALAEDKGPTDAEIAHIVVTANTVDIEAGNLAKEKGSSKEVKEFAERMVTDHSAVNKQASDLAKKLGVTPMDNDTSKSLMKGGKASLDKLKKMKGSEFDMHYVNNEVAYHEAVLGALDKVLVPNVDNAELKALMVKVRPAFVAHLEHAKHMQASMKKK